MYNSDTDLIFPPRVIPALRILRGESWRNLLDLAINQEPAGLDRLSFVLLMVRLMGCTSCQADSFRALRGCTQCAYQAVRRYRGSDEDLMKLFVEARNEVERYMGNGKDSNGRDETSEEDSECQDNL